MTTDAECFSGVCAAGWVGQPSSQTAVATTAGGAVSCLLQQTSSETTNADVEAGCLPANEDM